MSEAATPDIGRIINLIMENPKLIEEISNLAKSDAKSEDVKAAEAPPPPESSVSTGALPLRSHSRRGELLTLLKPYLSERRASAIDSMVSVADVLKLMKRGD